MSVSIIQNPLRNYLTFGFVFLLMPLLVTPVYAIEPFPKNNLSNNPDDFDSLPFLGIGGDFGRWENGIIHIAYNPNGAPSGKSINEMESLFRSSFGILENIAGIHFDYQGTTTADVTNYVDSVVVIAWDELEEGVAGRAGPQFGAYQSSDLHRLGYWPYLDGRVLLSTLVSTDQITQRVIIHELIHLLGLGHSENPISIMNRNYSFFDLPQTDDIQALQALYGPPDEYVRPIIQTNLAPMSLVDILSGGTLLRDFQNTGLYSRLEGADVNDIKPISFVSQTFNPKDQFWFRIGFSRAPPGKQMAAYVRDPLGNLSSSSSRVNEKVAGSEYFFAGYAKDLLLQPGDWEITIGYDGRIFHRDKITVVSTPPSFNHTPLTNLNTQFDGQRQFTLNLDIIDPEGDIETVAWHVPNNVSRVIRDGNTLIVDLNPGQPSVSQIFGGVSDDNVRPGDDDPSGRGPGKGFGGLVSRYLVMPAKTGVPTYFVNEQLLHIPDLEIEGGLFSLNFKLTKLEDISLKFIEFDQLSNIALSGNANLDLATGELLLSRLIVVENLQESEVKNVRFSLIPNSNPIRIKLEL